jgi:hypothetical protein
MCNIQKGAIQNLLLMMLCDHGYWIHGVEICPEDMEAIPQEDELEYE